MITLYDFDSRLEGRAYNAQGWKARLTLNYKGLTYRTVWVEYPDIETTCKQIGALPSMTAKKANGDPLYTLPVISDDSTGMVISDSLIIAEYLDKTYPHSPVLVPKGTRALQLALVDAFELKKVPYMPFVVSAAPRVMNPRSVEYLRGLREPHFGRRLEDVAPAPGTEERAAAWAKWKEVMGSFDAWMRKEDVWIMGDTLSFADLVIASELLSMKWWVFGEESEEWKDVLSWHDGRWARLNKNTEPYM